MDQAFGADALVIAYLLPDEFAEDDVIDTYPFFIHSLTGGVPIPESPDTMTGSIKDATLTGSFGQSPTLTGSITGTARRQSRTRKAA